MEGAWRLFGNETHMRYPPVLPLDIHLENGQRVYFKNARDVANKPPPVTPLTSFFALNKSYRLREEQARQNEEQARQSMELATLREMVAQARLNFL